MGKNSSGTARSAARNTVSRSTVSRSALALVAVAAALALSACGSPGSGTTKADAVGTWGDTDAAYLSLAEDGTVTGSDGCNRLTGTWEAEEDEIDFGQMASTMMACPDGQATLEGLDSATISGDTMTVYADDDAQLATLERTSDQPESGN